MPCDVVQPFIRGVRTCGDETFPTGSLFSRTWIQGTRGDEFQLVTQERMYRAIIVLELEKADIRAGLAGMSFQGPSISQKHSSNILHL